jgi:hypothetical protein
MGANQPDASISISDHGGWAILVTAASDGTLLDRRRVQLVDDNLPKIPHHSEGQKLPLNQAIALVNRVQISAERHARIVLAAVAKTVAARITGVALRQCPTLPPTIAERIKDYRAQNVADWVMYRQALAGAAQARGWAVHWYDPKALPMEKLDAHFLQIKKSIGPPWDKDYRIAMAAALNFLKFPLASAEGDDADHRH